METGQIGEVRRERLRALMKERFEGNQSLLGAAINRAPNIISRILGKEKKPIGEKMCRHIEAALGLPSHWMDGPLADGAPDDNVPPLPAQKGITLTPDGVLRILASVLHPVGMQLEDVMDVAKAREALAHKMKEPVAIIEAKAPARPKARAVVTQSGDLVREKRKSQREAG